MSTTRTEAAGARRGPRLTVRQLADLPIWLIRTTTGRPLNCVAIAGPDGMILVNTGTDRRHGKSIGEQVASLTGKPITAVVYPHHPSGGCQGTVAIVDQDDARRGKVVILAAGHRDGRQHPGVTPNLLIDRECFLELAGVTVRLLPVGTRTVNGINVYLPRQRVAVIADEPLMWKHDIGPQARPAGGTPFARAVNWFLRFPVDHLLGSHMLPLSGPDVHLVLRTYLERNHPRQEET